MDDSDLIISFNPPPSPSLFSWACTGHHELWRDKGAACTHHVVAAWSITEKKRRGKHLHQESWQVHWQQGSLWHLLRFWQHPVLQGKAFLPLSLPFVTGNLKVEVAQQVVWLYSHARALLETMCYRVVKSILPLTHFFHLFCWHRNTHSSRHERWKNASIWICSCNIVMWRCREKQIIRRRGFASLNQSVWM